jgi:hypothetical protein
VVFLQEGERKVVSDAKLNYIGLPRLLLKNNNMPELLGLFGKKWAEIIEASFMRFMDFVLFVSRNFESVYKFIEELSEEGNEQKSEIRHSIKTRDIVKTTVFLRVMIINHMYQGVSNNITRYNLSLWASTHVDLTLELENSPHTKSDDYLFFNEENSPHLYPRLLRSYPHDARILTAGELVNTTSCLYQSTQNSNSDSSKSRDRSFLGTVRHLIFIKPRPHTCQKRKITKMVIEEIEKSRDLKKLFLQIIEISLNGDYQWANVKLSYRNRCYLRKMILEDKFDMRKFVKDHEYFLIFILREYVLYIITLSPSFDKFTANKEYKNFIIQSMDLIRFRLNQLFNKNLFIGDKEFIEEIQFLEQKIHPIFLTFGTKTDKNPPAIVFHKKMESVFRSAKLVGKPEDYVTLKQKARVLALIYYIQSLGHIHMKCYFDVNYLKLLDLNPELFFYFKFVLREYCETEAADNPINKKFGFMLCYHFRDLCVIRYYLSMMAEAYSRIRFVLPKSVTDLQTFGFERKMCFFNITEQVRQSYFCNNCGSWANYVMKHGDKKSRKNMACYTPHECAQRLDNDKIVCLKARSRNRNMKISSEANRIKKDKCMTDSLNVIDMIGVIQKIGHKLYMKCWMCDCIFEFKINGSYGFTCSNHIHDDEVKGMGLYIKPQQVALTFPCFYCNGNIYSKGHNMKTIGAKITVVDDIDREPLVKGLRKHKIRQIGLCNLHYAYFLEIQKQSVIPLLSVILEKLVHKTNIKIRKMSSTRG